MITRIVDWSGRPWLAPVVIFAAALLLFSLNLDRPPYPDELQHALAGQHLLATGHPVIADGEYTRGILYTWLVALSYAIFGDSLSSARIPAVLLVALRCTNLVRLGEARGGSPGGVDHGRSLRDVTVRRGDRAICAVLFPSDDVLHTGRHLHLLRAHTERGGCGNALLC